MEVPRQPYGLKRISCTLKTCLQDSVASTGNGNELRLLQILCDFPEACILSSFLPRQHHWCCQKNGETEFFQIKVQSLSHYLHHVSVNLQINHQSYIINIYVYAVSLIQFSQQVLEVIKKRETEKKKKKETK